MEQNFIKSFGCIPSPKDIRDYRIEVPMGAAQFPEEFIIDNLPNIKNQSSVGSCHDEKTEVLTKDGWKFFKDITYDDLLASADPETGNLIFEKPINIICENYSGDMIIGKHRSLDFMVTPNHKMVVRKCNCHNHLVDEYSFVDASELGYYCGLRNRFYQNAETDLGNMVFEEEKIKNGNILPRLEIDMHDWVKFVGIYLAEGTLYKNGPESHWRIQLAAYKKREKDFIRNLLDRMLNSHGYESEDRFSFCNKRVWKKLEEYGLCGVKSYNKFIPSFIFDLDRSYISDFLFGFGMGDGSLQNTWHYFTSSKVMAEQLQILTLMCGEFSKISIRTDRPGLVITKNNKSHICQTIHDSYTVSTWSKNSGQSITKKHDISIKHYEGKVYCAEVPTYHTLITRRNQDILFSGNCVSHSLSEAVEHFNEKQQNNHQIFSTAFIYGNRSNSSWKGSGMITRDALNNLIKYGDCPIKDMPGNKEVPNAISYFEEKYEEVKDKAFPHRISTYFRCYTKDEIKTALMNYGPVVVCVDWFTDIFVNPVTGLVSSRCNADNTDGGHCMLIVGWNKDGWVIQNSWGILWGKAGRATFPYDFPLRETWGITDEIINEDDNDIVKPQICSVLAKIVNFFLNLFR